jgi:hypothetical protein
VRKHRIIVDSLCTNNESDLRVDAVEMMPNDAADEPD